jgi:hypothetical protein
MLVLVHKLFCTFFYLKEDYYYYVVLNLLLHVENNNILRIEPCQSQGSSHLQQWSPTKAQTTQL